MRLGAYPCRLQEGSRLRGIYGCSEIGKDTAIVMR